MSSSAEGTAWVSSSAEGTAWLISEEKGNKTVDCGAGSREWRLPTWNSSMCLFEHQRVRVVCGSSKVNTGEKGRRLSWGQA